ncbi:MAG: protein translocase subunit SecD, partial [Clostridia bacterium]
MKAKSTITLCVTVVLIVVVSLLAVNGLTIGNFSIKPVTEGISLGLDLRGGIYAVYVATDTEQDDFETLLNGTISVLRDRLTAQGFTEATVTRQGSNRIRVEIPDVSDPNSILDIIGKPAHLEFLDPDGKVVIEGADIKNAHATYYDGNTSQPVVAFELNETGKKAFAEATQKNIGRQIAIVLDGQLISAPTVESAIT